MPTIPNLPLPRALDRSPADLRNGLRRLTLLGFALTALAGCSGFGDKEAGNPLATIDVPGASRIAVIEAARDVFYQDGYVGAFHTGDASLTFETKGGKTQELIWGGMAKDGVWIRIKVWVKQSGTGQHVSARAFIVRNRRKATEDERPLYVSRSGFLRSKLKDIRDRAQVYTAMY